jgi:hypothetical protein
MGNVLLRDFDRAMNGRGITCIRYIDDFLILGPSRKAVTKAFEAARRMLSALDLDAYDPLTRPDKASTGPVCDGFEFLGCSIDGSLVQPSRKARERLLERVRGLLDEGRRTMTKASKGRVRYGSGAVQTVDAVNRTVKGWAEAFAFCNARQGMEEVDAASGRAVLGRSRAVACSRFSLDGATIDRCLEHPRHQAEGPI